MTPSVQRLKRILRKRVHDGVVATVAGIAGIAASYGIAGFTPEFIAGPIAGVLARRMPGAVITFVIVFLGDLGQYLNLFTAIIFAYGLLAFTVVTGFALGRRVKIPFVAPIVAGVGSGFLSFVVTRGTIASAGTGTAVAVVVLISELLSLGRIDDLLPAQRAKTFSPPRRRVLGGLSSGFALSAIGFMFGQQGGTHGDTIDTDRDVGNTGGDTEQSVSSLLDEAASKSLDVAGLEPLVSEDFYKVDINSTDPTVDVEDWSLKVTGAVDNEVTYSYEELQAMETENRFVSLRCVGDPINGKKLDNAVWTGVPIMDLIEPAGVPDTCCVMLRAYDGFFEEFPVEALENGLLAVGMNGKVLPRGHGYPARALIPGHWGEINVKWITHIEILEQEQEGYWEKLGWHGTGPVNTIAKLHVENRLEDGRIEVAGHAYAGTRGVDKVEVSTDGGETWTEAKLSDPLPGNDVWRQWVHRYEPPVEAHTVVVRAVDGNGNLQPQEQSNAFPSGSTGWVSTEIDP